MAKVYFTTVPSLYRNLSLYRIQYRPLYYRKYNNSNTFISMAEQENNLGSNNKKTSPVIWPKVRPNFDSLKSLTES